MNQSIIREIYKYLEWEIFFLLLKKAIINLASNSLYAIMAYMLSVVMIKYAKIKNAFPI